MALLTASAGGTTTANESFPSVHHEPITVRILGGKVGQPLAHLHVVLVGGYTQRDLQLGYWREEVLTDARGEARLSYLMTNLPFVQISVEKKHPCFTDSSASPFSMERIRRDGLSTANRCGIATVENVPGVFAVFVKAKPPAPAAPQRAKNEID
jgi:hypothetical protein